MSSCPLQARPPAHLDDSFLAGVSACVFTAAGQLRVCPHYTTMEHVPPPQGFTDAASLLQHCLPSAKRK